MSTQPGAGRITGRRWILLLIVAIGSPIVALRINRAASELRRNLYVADVNNASVALQRRQFGRASELLKRYNRTGRQRRICAGSNGVFSGSNVSPTMTFSSRATATRSPAQFSPLMPPGSRPRAETGRFRSGTLESRQRIRTLTGFDDFIDLKALAFSPDNQLLVAKGGIDFAAGESATGRRLARR